MNRYRVVSLVAALSLVALLGPATTSLAFAAGGVSPNAVVTATPTATATATPTATPVATPTATPTATTIPVIQLTFIKEICPSYSVVPANKTPTVADQTGGHGAQLDTSYQTSVVNPATDIPASCHRADGWSFQMYGAFQNGILSPTVGSPVTTGADGAGTGSATITLNSAEYTLGQTLGSPTGLWIVELQQPSIATFGALRCFDDIQNGDNVENVHGLGTNDQHIYCISYNVAVAQATPTPFQSIQGETSVPRSSTTPPPTSTGSTDGPGSNTTPMLALLISLAFGAMGLVAVESQRRTRVGRR